MELAKKEVDIGILVRDIDACLAFYCDTLGLPKVGTVEFPGRTQHRIRVGGALIKLMQFHGEPPPPGPRDRQAQAGIRYFSITVPDLHALVAGLEGKGLVFSVPPRQSPSGAWIAMVEDPDGNTVEFIGA